MTSREECTEFLQWALPRMQMRWVGFRRVRSQVCKRVSRRIDELGLSGFAEYRKWIERDQQEWPVLDRCCRVTISRFYRDREVFEGLRHDVVPRIARLAESEERRTVDAWSCGCASGEEPYTLAMAWWFDWRGRFPGLTLNITASDSDPAMLERARRGSYRSSSLRDLPESWIHAGFTHEKGTYRVIEPIRDAVDWRREDVRRDRPRGPFDLVLCRNLAFTYYVKDLQRRILNELLTVIRPGGALVVGSRESVPEPTAALEPWGQLRSVYRRRLSG